MQRVLVFCGSSPGARADYALRAAELGRLLAGRGLELVYGGAAVGLMGALADAALDSGGKVIGVIPRRLVEREIAHPGLTELREVSSMHERKALMAELADAVIALPGGSGTLDELFELFTWNQLGLHRAPIGLLDVAGYWQPLLGAAGPHGRRTVSACRVSGHAAGGRPTRRVARRAGELSARASG